MANPSAVPERVYVSLGSNVGDCAGHLDAAVKSLSRIANGPVVRASLYRTEPMDVEDQPWFLNTVVELQTTLSPEEFLAECKLMERTAGRIPGRRGTPRPLDADIVLFGERILSTGTVQIPHPRFRSRRFVLEPLVEIAPQARDPVSGQTALELLRALTDSARVFRTST